MKGQPENSYVYGSNWYWNEGYKKKQNNCVSIFDEFTEDENSSDENVASSNSLGDLVITSDENVASSNSLGDIIVTSLPTNKTFEFDVKKRFNCLCNWKSFR